LFSLAVVNAAPSTTNRFGTSCDWQKPLSADRFGSAPHAATAVFMNRVAVHVRTAALQK
jgi:hypothetical protein